MHLAITPIKEAAENSSADACLRMILSYYDIPASRDEIITFFADNDKDALAHAVLVGLFAKRKGLDVECLGYNLVFFDPKDTLLSPSELIDKLQQVKLPAIEGSNWLGSIQAIIKALKEDVRYTIKKPSINLICSYLEKGIPLIVTVNDSILYDRQGDIYIGHDIILNGIKDEEIFYIDPKFGEEKTISKEDLMFAILSRKLTADDAYMIAVSKNA